MSETLISLQGVTKRYLRRRGLQEATFDLPRGQVIGLVGPNGSGKSTTLKLIAGLLRPSSGRVQVNGEQVSRRSSRHVAFLSDAESLYDFYTVREMIEYYAIVYADFDREKAQEALAFMGLELKQRVGDLSKGNRGRLKIVLTVSRRVPLLVMDEPLSGLDPLVRQSILKGLISFLDLGEQTLLLSTHEVAEVEPLLDRVVLLQEGRVLAIADVEEIRAGHGMSLVEWMRETLADAR